MPDTTAATAIAVSELKARAAGLEPVLAGRAEATEQLRRIPDETIADL